MSKTFQHDIDKLLHFQYSTTNDNIAVSMHNISNMIGALKSTDFQHGKY